MPDVNVLTSGQSRVFIQKDGANPGAPYAYLGCASLDGPKQDLGTPDPVYCPSSSERGQWDIVQSVPKTPSLGTTDFTQHADRFLKDVWWQLKNQGCQFNLTVVNGACQRPDDFTKWDSKLVFIGSRLTSIGLGALNALSGDDNGAVDLTGSLSYIDMQPIYPILMGEVAAVQVVAEILDGLVHDTSSCGECGSSSDGCQKWYFLQVPNTGSPGLSSQIIYSKDGGKTWASLDIPPLGGASGVRMESVGERLVVISFTAGGHVWADYVSVDAGLTTGWAKVTGGYVAGKSPLAIYSKSPTETFVAAQGGYIYLMSDPTLAVTVLSDGSVTTQDLRDVHGYGRTIVAVGGNNAVVKSDNGGQTWSLITGPAVAIQLNAIWCLSNQVWIVGAGNGALYYTLNGGVTWVQISLDAGVNVINDIRFTPDGTVGYMAVEVGGVGRIYRSTDSGYSWQYSAPAINGMPASQRLNCVVPCGLNVVGTGGRKTVGGDGVLAIGR